MGTFFHQWERQRDRLLLWVPVLFGAGIGLYFALTFEPPLWLSIAAPLAVAAAFWMRRAGNLRLAAWIFAAAIVAAGFMAAQWRTQDVATPMLQKRIGPMTLTGQVAVLETFTDGWRVTLAEPHVNGLQRHLTPKRVRLRLRGEQPRVLPGDWIQARAILSPPSPPAMPGAFDFQRHAYFQSVGGVGFALGAIEVTARADAGATVSPANALARLRGHVTERILAALPEGTGAVAAALITGARHAIPEADLQAMRDSGLAHLLSISGLHIGLVAGLLFAAVRATAALVPALVLRHPTKKWAAVVALIGAFGYALIAGATLPTQRAFLMLAVALIGVLLDRRGLSLRSVAWAALVVLALQPESLLSASFQMSFSAVTMLIAAYEAYARRRESHASREGRSWTRRLAAWAGLYIAGVLLTTFIAGAATAPFAIFHFNRVADYGLLANLAAVPLTALWVMPWAIVGMVLMPVGAEAIGLIPMGWGIEGVVAVARAVAGWPGAVTLLPAMPGWGLALTVLGGLWLAIWKGRFRLYGVGGVAAGMLALAWTGPPDILVDGQGQILALRDADNRLALSNGRRAAFERDIWLRRLASDEKPEVWPVSGRALAGRLNCDAAGCLYRKGDIDVALVRHERALAEDCWRAHLVIAPIPLRGRCPAPVVIDRFDLWRHGAHAIWLEEGRVRVETVNATRGQRPWTVQPPPRTRGSN
jgi:competence protein ComEC